MNNLLKEAIPEEKRFVATAGQVTKKVYPIANDVNLKMAGARMENSGQLTCEVTVGINANGPTPLDVDLIPPTLIDHYTATESLLTKASWFGTFPMASQGQNLIVIQAVNETENDQRIILNWLTETKDDWKS